MSEVKLNEYEVLNDLLLLQWGDGSENALPLKSLRDNCPCANCAGETDVFGNIYKGPPQIMNEKSYRIKGFQPVGYYAIRPFWDCLLYTSPSPRDLSTSRMPSSA